VRLVAATVFALDIPFVESFRHSAHDRAGSDSVVVRVVDEAGIEGFGEGVPRPYVTGETVESVLDHLAKRLWPGIAGRALPGLGGETLEDIDAWIPAATAPGVACDNASRAALELAVLDVVLRGHGVSAARVLPPARRKVTYSGVITAGSLDNALQQARRMKLVGLTQVKIKVGFADDAERVRALREAFGPGVSLRLDANGAWTPERAIEVLGEVAPFDIAAVEQPLPRGPVEALVRLRRETAIPLVADESLVTLADAEALIAAEAVDIFNVRVSKCGGLARSLRIARRAAAAGLRVQVGSQVGETAILSAAGRHLAAHLPEVAFTEGSFGTLLLTEDVSPDGVRFGHRGEAPLLDGAGLGVRVLEERLRKYARSVVEL
jgi:L-Ala-D/L-Glu epimerase / N-acetyl-D-glutamate racemase